jgi:hemoglobin-like flavoprotein
LEIYHSLPDSGFIYRFGVRILLRNQQNPIYMTRRQIRLVRNSWSAAGEEPLMLGVLFYDHLFSHSPEIRTIFRSPVSLNTKRLMQAVGSILQKLDVLEDSIYDITRIADELVPEGVIALHYPAIGAALLWAVEQRLGNAWNRYYLRAWQAMYSELASMVYEVADAA